eukprot:79394_1
MSSWRRDITCRLVRIKNNEHQQRPVDANQNRSSNNQNQDVQIENSDERASNNDIEEVKEFLSVIEDPNIDYTHLFIENGYGTLSNIKTMGDADLIAMNVPMQHRILILQKVKKMRLNDALDGIVVELLSSTKSQIEDILQRGKIANYSVPEDIKLLITRFAEICIYLSLHAPYINIQESKECGICKTIGRFTAKLNCCTSAIFCALCIIKWFLRNKSCPLCRKQF